MFVNSMSLLCAKVEIVRQVLNDFVVVVALEGFNFQDSIMEV